MIVTNTLSSIGLDSSTLKILAVLYGFLFLLIILIASSLYILESVGLYKISKKTGIKNKWYAFFPFFSDVLREKIVKVNFKRNGSHKKLLIMKIVSFSLRFIVILLFVTSFIDIAFRYDDLIVADEEITAEILKPMILPLVFYLLSFISSLIYKIMRYVNLWGICSLLYHKPIVLIVLSIIFPIIIPFMLYFIGNRLLSSEHTENNVR